MELSDQVVLITGGTKGVGRGIAQVMLAASAKVIVCARKPPAELPAHDGQEAAFFPVDVRDPEQVEQLVKQIMDRYQHLDIVINNAGGSPLVDAATASPRFSEAIIKLNLLAPLYLAQAANRVMQEQATGGHIINIASVSGTRPSPGTAAYGAAKAGLINLTRSLAMEWAPRVRVNAIVAGPVKTEQWELHYGNEKTITAIENNIAMQRMAIPEDIGNACLALASPLLAYMTGSSIVLDGGGERPPFLDLAAASVTKKTGQD